MNNYLEEIYKHDVIKPFDESIKRQVINEYGMNEKDHKNWAKMIIKENDLTKKNVKEKASSFFMSKWLNEHQVPHDQAVHRDLWNAIFVELGFEKYPPFPYNPQNYEESLNLQFGEEEETNIKNYDQIFLIVERGDFQTSSILERDFKTVDSEEEAEEWVKLIFERRKVDVDVFVYNISEVRNYKINNQENDDKYMGNY